MGREHRLPRDPRVREAGAGRNARVPAAVQIVRRRDLIRPGASIVGIDVGEDFLDAAVVTRRAATLRFERIGLAGVDSIASLASRISARIPELGATGVALVDSPRWPRDRELASGRARHPSPRGRTIDVALRAIVGRLSMFPTPPLDYFARCAQDPACKPHLRALAIELFPTLAGNSRRRERVTGGHIFTRFMIAGFATYRALESAGVTTFESYPDLAYRLWMPRSGRLRSKSEGRRALNQRSRILRRVAQLAAIELPVPRTLDEADAAILAVGAAAAARAGRGLLVLTHCAEGRFAIAGNAPDAESSA